jgi:hypothetical protein
MKRPTRNSLLSRAGSAVSLAGLIAFAPVPVSAAGANAIATLPEQAPARLAAAGIPRRLVAIDNVCAWPNLVALKDGTFVAIVFNQPSHGNAEGDVDCWGSVDGLSWKFLSTVTRHAPHTVRMNHGAGLNAKGEIVVLCNGWDHVEPPRNLARSRPIHSVVCISADGGKSWDRREGAALPQVPGYSWQVPFGDIITAANGDLVAGTYAFGKQDEAMRADAKNPKSDSHDGMRGHVYAARSRDGGRTWVHFAPVVKDRHVEAAMLHAGGGHWLAASRRFGFRDLDILVSDDDAFTWRHVTTLDLKPVSAAHLLKLSDGRILLTYGNRTSGDRGIDVRTSKDGGKTWGAPQRLAVAAGDLGYPDAVELPGERILVAYYASSGPQHQRYHMGVINLAIDEIR